MENQMKIVFVTMKEFDMLWNKAQPQQRFTGDLTTLSLMLKHLNTLFIVGKQEDFVATLEDRIPESWLSQLQEKKADPS